MLLHYGIPFANTIKLGLSKPKLWTIPRGNPFVHPSWQTHQIVADLVSNQLGRVFAAASGRPALASRPLVCPARGPVGDGFCFLSTR